MSSTLDLKRLRPCKLDKIVQEVGSKLENHSKNIINPKSVEVKLNKVVEEPHSHRKAIEQYQQMFLTLLSSYHNC